MIKKYKEFLFKNNKPVSICGRKTITVDQFVQAKYLNIQVGMEYSTIMPTGRGMITSTVMGIYWDSYSLQYMCQMLSSIGSWNFSVPLAYMDKIALNGTQINTRNIPLIAGYILRDVDQNSNVKFKPWGMYQKSVQVPTDKISNSTDAPKNSRMVLGTDDLTLNSKATYYTCGDVYKPTIVVDLSDGTVISEPFIGYGAAFTYPDNYIVNLNPASVDDEFRSLVIITGDMEYYKNENLIEIRNDEFSSLQILDCDGKFIVQ